MIFVFGSNEGGIHGAGAAKTAYEKHGADWGKSYGHYGDSFAIPTKDSKIRHTLPLEVIQTYINGFIAYAESKPNWDFQVTRIGCGLAGLADDQVARMFIDSPRNCYFDEKWKPWLGNDVNYWGTYG